MKKELLWATKWTRQGLSYFSTAHVRREDSTQWSITIKLDILSYHLIRYIHGPDEPSNMLIRTVNQRLSKA